MTIKSYHTPYRRLSTPSAMMLPAAWQKVLSILFMLFLIAQVSFAQESKILRDGIATLQVVAGERWQSMPVVELSGDPIHISFDDMSHTPKEYAYRLEHCEADWTPSDALFSTDFVQGFNGTQTIKETEQSINTNHLYTHYSLSFPNEDCRITMSGNYRLTVFDLDEGEDAPLLTACFMVVEPLMSISLLVSSNTDMDINRSHQQVNATVGYGSLRVTNPATQLKTVVLQNGQWRNAAWNVPATMNRGTGLEWQHERCFIFDAGNEYRKFETLSTGSASMGVNTVGWDGEDYHATLYLDEPRHSYLTDESANGAFYIRNSDNIDNDITADYLWVHFLLDTDLELPAGSRIWIDGVWTRCLPENQKSALEMKYNGQTHQYEASVLLKQGYYSYQYLLQDANGNARLLPSEGSFFQTENQYQMLVYYRGQGDRTDRLVGYQEVQIK